MRLDLEPLTRFRRPAELFAAAPAEAAGRARDEVRLLVARPGGVQHVRFRDLPAQLDAGDLVVVNASQTVNGAVDAEVAGPQTRPVVLHVATDLRDGTWVVELRSAPDAVDPVLDAAAGSVVRVPGTGAAVRLLSPYPRSEGSSPTGRGNRLWRAVHEGTEPLRSLLDRVGRPIAYGYLDARYDLADYRTVLGSVPGSAEMPSAGRPFTQGVLDALGRRGVAVASIVLHTGVSSQEAGEAPQPEWFEVGRDAVDAIRSTRARGGRVVAVGTTVTRALESAHDASGGRLAPTSGWTERVVTREAPPRVVDGLVTGWHDPQASHLLLVEAVAGAELTQAAYDAAVDHGYRWHEFGDSALLLPDRRARGRSAA